MERSMPNTKRLNRNPFQHPPLIKIYVFIFIFIFIYSFAVESSKWIHEWKLIIIIIIINKTALS
jgi:hypothetical protein